MRVSVALPGYYDRQLCQSRKTDQKTFAWFIQFATDSFKIFLRFLHLLSVVNYMYHSSQLCGHVTIQFARQWISDVTGYQTSLAVREEHEIE